MGRPRVSEGVGRYVYTSNELVEMLIKHTNLHEGRWTLMVNFGITAGSFGPSADKPAPGVAVMIGQVGIQRAPENAVEGSWLDAAIVNPKPKRG